MKHPQASNGIKRMGTGITTIHLTHSEVRKKDKEKLKIITRFRWIHISK